MDMDRTKPDVSAPDPEHNVSSSMSISTSSMIGVSPSKLSDGFVASGPSNRAPAVAPYTGLDNIDTSGTTSNENQEVSSSMGPNEDALSTSSDSAQVPSSMGSEAPDEDALPGGSSS